MLLGPHNLNIIRNYKPLVIKQRPEKSSSFYPSYKLFKLKLPIYLTELSTSGCNA